MTTPAMESTSESLLAAGKGILAADESYPTIKKRFASIDLASTEKSRRNYRDMLFTTPGLNEFISGVILFDETLQAPSLKIWKVPRITSSQLRRLSIIEPSATVSQLKASILNRWKARIHKTSEDEALPQFHKDFPDARRRGRGAGTASSVGYVVGTGSESPLEVSPKSQFEEANEERPI